MVKITLRVTDARKDIDGIVRLTALDEDGCTWSSCLGKVHPSAISAMVSSGVVWQSGYDRQQRSTARLPRVLLVQPSIRVTHA